MEPSSDPDGDDDPFFTFRFWLVAPLAVIASVRAIRRWLSTDDYRVVTDSLDLYIDLTDSPDPEPDDIWDSLRLDRSC